MVQQTAPASHGAGAAAGAFTDATTDDGDADAGRLGVCHPEAGLAGITEVLPKPTGQEVTPCWQARPAKAEMVVPVATVVSSALLSQQPA